MIVNPLRPPEPAATSRVAPAPVIVSEAVTGGVGTLRLGTATVAKPFAITNPVYGVSGEPVWMRAPSSVPPITRVPSDTNT